VNEQCVQCEVVKQTCLNFYTPLDMCPKSDQAEVPAKCPKKYQLSVPKVSRKCPSWNTIGSCSPEVEFQPCDQKVSQKFHNKM